MPAVTPEAASATPAALMRNSAESHGRPFSLVLDLPPLGAAGPKTLSPAPPETEVIETEAEQEKPEAAEAGEQRCGAATDTTR